MKLESQYAMDGRSLFIYYYIARIYLILCNFMLIIPDFCVVLYILYEFLYIRQNLMDKLATIGVIAVEVTLGTLVEIMVEIKTISRLQ